MTKEQERKFLKEAQDQLKKAMDEDEENRRLAKEDLEFITVPGAQWPADVKANRLAKGRPCLEINKMPVFVDQVVGDQRMNRPSIKVIPVDSKGDPETARILGGWIKHVQQISRADIAIDHAFEHAVACGYGALRVVTKFVPEKSFNQEAFIETIENALGVFWGKHMEYDCSDAMYCFIVSDMDREEYEQTYGEKPTSFNYTDPNYAEGWATKDTVRVAEYYVKKPVEETIYLLEDGRTVEVPEEGDVVVKKRKSKSYKIMWYLLTGDRVIDEKEWAGTKYIPVVPVWGKEMNVAGKRYIRGLIRNAKDSQRMFNYWSSCDTEIVALQPKIPYILTPKQISGFENQWKSSDKENYPYLLVNSDREAPGWPHRESPPQASSGMVERIQNTDQEMRDTIGLQKASLGMQSNERSGVAIRERKKEGDVGTFAFIDNLSRSIEHLGRILVDVAPVILDNERIQRLGLEGGEQEFVPINTLVEGRILNDMSVGTYDVVVTVGPSFTTQRTEARQSMSEFIQYYPQAAPIIGDLYAKVMDWPGAEEVAKRLEFLLPPEVRALKAIDDQKKGLPPPPQLPPPQPPPEEVLKVEEMKLKLEEQKLKLAQEQLKLEQQKLELEQMAVQNKETVRNMVNEIIKDAVAGVVAGSAAAKGEENAS